MWYKDSESSKLSRPDIASSSSRVSRTIPPPPGDPGQRVGQGMAPSSGGGEPFPQLPNLTAVSCLNVRHLIASWISLCLAEVRLFRLCWQMLARAGLWPHAAAMMASGIAASSTCPLWVMSQSRNCDTRRSCPKSKESGGSLIADRACHLDPRLCLSGCSTKSRNTPPQNGASTLPLPCAYWPRL